MMIGTDEPLDPAVARFLLLGVLPSPGEHQAIARLAPLYRAGAKAWAAAWTRHEPQLRAFAEAHNIRPVHSQTFYGQAIAAREQRLRGTR